MLEISYNLKPFSARRREAFVPIEPLPFGKLRSDHMFLMDFKEGEWHNARIVPYGPIELSPGAKALHYSQEIFEGAKAFMHPDESIHLFRFDQNATRFNSSADIMCMPNIPEEDQIEAVKALIDVDRLHYPQQEGASLYIRPFMVATDDALGVRPSESYLFGVILAPSGPYYGAGFKPSRILLTDKFHRATPGGTGKAKTGGNYAASLRPGRLAKRRGCSQVLYVDVSKTFLEEYGAMNHFQVFKDGSVVIPSFTDTILESITARSIIELAPRFERPILQKDIRLEDFLQDVVFGKITETGGLGTAAAVAPVGSYYVDVSTRPSPLEITVGDGSVGPVTKTFFNALQAIQTGKAEAVHGWLDKVER